MGCDWKKIRDGMGFDCMEIRNQAYPKNMVSGKRGQLSELGSGLILEVRILSPEFHNPFSPIHKTREWDVPIDKAIWHLPWSY